MPPSTIRLALDLSGGSIRIVEGIMGGAMRCGSAATPDGSLVGGRIADPAAVAQALKSLLARTEITLTRSLVAVSDALATFRVLQLAATSTQNDIDAAIAHEFQFDPQRTSTRWLEVDAAGTGRLIYAVAWDRALVKNVTDVVRQAGLEANVIELKSASVARAVPAPSCVLVDLSSQPAELVLIDHHLPYVWHTFAVEDATGGDAMVASLAQPLRSVLRYHRRGTDRALENSAPVFISTEQAISPHALSDLSTAIDQPVHPLPAPARVPEYVRHPTYLACLGLLMRRTP